MLLKPPFAIGSRLLPCVQIGDGTLSLQHVHTDSQGRQQYQWFADLPSGEFSDDDLRSGMQGCTTQAMFGTFLAFLGAAAESFAYFQRTGREGENMDLFPLPVVEWAAEHSDEIGMLRCEIEEDGDTLIVD